VQYAHRYIQYAIKALTGYDGSLPLQHYLKQFFAADKKYGSKDRKYITQLCYCYYRLGHALPQLPMAERMVAAVFLCNQPPLWTTLFPEEWQGKYVPELEKRVKFLQQVYPALDLKDIFPWSDQCSDAIDLPAFTRSHLVQPDVFLRIRPGYDKKVIAVLKEHAIPYKLQHNSGVALPPNTKMDELLVMNREAVVQDLSSQKVGDVMKRVPVFEKPLRVWDCCAASGGKSILAVDILKKVLLTVSDVRGSIMHNLKQRFTEAGIQQYRSFIADLTNPAKILPQNGKPVFPPEGFDLVICDAPCTGSGTWGRTPEQLSFFKEEEIARYAALQQKIADTAVQQVGANGYLLYITCSVFRQENEEQVAYMQQQHGLQLVHRQVITGYQEKADTMFAALLTRKKELE
jgi:16S rRNA (cytosine967-C5)-methyltransferase